MANTMKALQTVTVGAGGVASISFTSIPATYTDLILKLSVRDNRAGGIDGSYIYFNSDTTSANYRGRRLIGTGSGVSQSNTLVSLLVNSTDSTSNTFSSNEIYIPAYLSSNKKSFVPDSGQENNATTAYTGLYAGLWDGTSPITSVTITPESGTLFLQYTTATLYGVFNQDVNAVASAPTIGTATAGSLSASVTFTGVSGAASYTMTSSPGSITATGTTSPITVTGLTAGTAYTFTCVANNPFGSSAASAASNSATPTPAAYFLQTWEGEPKVTYSTNGIDWTAATVDSASGGRDGDKFGSTYIVGRYSTSQPIATSTNLSSWTPRTVGGTAYAYCNRIATDGNIVVLGGGAGGYNSAMVLKTTTDFVTYTDRSALTYNTYALAYLNGYFIIADGNGNYAYSTNGTSWTQATAQWSAGGVPTPIVYFNGRWIFGGNGGEIRWSTTINPGSIWTSATGQNNVQIQGGAAGSTQVVFCHNDGNISRSTNGTSYTVTATGYSAGAYLSVSFGAGLWVLAARNAVIMTSPDAITWTSRTSGVTSGAGGSFDGFYG
jgi:hypothetical protein